MMDTSTKIEVANEVDRQVDRQVGQSFVSQTRKAWAGAAMSGLMAAAAASSQMDFSTSITGNDLRDLVVTFLLAAFASGGITYAVPNRSKP